MERLGRLLILSAVCCLVLLAFGALLSGPETVTANAELPSAPPQTIAAEALTSASADSDAPCSRPRQSHCRETASVICARTDTHDGPMCDGNGQVLRSQQYIRAVYQAFPPESLPG